MPYNNFKNRTVFTPDFFLFSKIYLFHHRNQFHNFKEQITLWKTSNQLMWNNTTLFLTEHGIIIASIILVNVKILSSQFLGRNILRQFPFKNDIQENAKRFDHRRAHNHKFQLLKNHFVFLAMKLVSSHWKTWE